LEIRDGAIRVRAVVGVGVQIDPYKLESYPYLTWQTTTNCTPCFPTCPCFGTWRSSWRLWPSTLPPSGKTGYRSDLYSNHVNGRQM